MGYILKYVQSGLPVNKSIFVYCKYGVTSDVMSMHSLDMDLMLNPAYIV